jgi:hypothetical protein
MEAGDFAVVSHRGPRERFAVKEPGKKMDSASLF